MNVRILLGLFLLLVSCSIDQQGVEEVSTVENSQSELSLDTLHVATMYGSSSYFRFRNEIVGYDVELSTHLADRLGKPVRIHLARTRSQMLNWLDEKRVDLIAYDMYETRELKANYRFVAYQPDSYLVLVQMIGVNTVTSIAELRGKTIHVPENSPHLQRLRSLNRELGGFINIVEVSDTISNDELIDQVLKKKIEYTLAYHNRAVLYKEHNRRMDIRLQVGFPQRNGWVIRKDDQELEKAIQNWENQSDTELFRSQLYGKYIIRNPYFASTRLRIPLGAISPYDHLFKKYAAEIDWDWRLLAAIAFHESGFDSAQVSRRGASGLMQLMPRTAANFGLRRENITNPEKNIEAGVQYIKSLNLLFRKVPDTNERMNFILASYNSGPAHVLDAMALAEKYGKNKYIWHGHVEPFLEKKSDPVYYNDEVVKYGRFRASETLRYVRNTLSTFQKFKGEL
jgi:membrane-bound lytic murein transglycosylase F